MNLLEVTHMVEAGFRIWAFWLQYLCFNCHTVLSQQPFLKEGNYLMVTPDQPVHSSVFRNMVAALKAWARMQT